MDRSLFLLFLGHAGISAGGEFLLKLVDPSSRVNKLQLAGVKRMTLTANVDFQLRANAAGDKRVAATATDLSFLVIGVNSLFHISFRSPDSFNQGWQWVQPWAGI